MLILAVIAVLHILPIMVLFDAYAELSQAAKRTPFQFGLQELLMLPLLASPTMLTYIFSRSDQYSAYSAAMMAYFVMIYQFSFALAGWCTVAPKTGWTRAFRLLVGSMVGLFALAVSCVLIGLVLEGLFGRGLLGQILT